ncbi:MAG: metal ABC transporter permease [Planctomycetes bacterium]|nr:metal ABC transporter permease [Planctomycetota bacterium]MBI3845767.1 metal ABC transporter permease [Planctomycetota bacterium]
MPSHDYSYIWLPLAACLVVASIHSYLGLHILAREVIFVDLSLAQIAALGTTIAVYLGWEPTSNAAYVFSLVFAFLGAAVFAVSRVREGRIPQEAVIGIVYAVASAAAILVVAKAPHGAEEIRDILVGNIVFVQPPTILIAAGVYAGLGLFHWIFRRQFLAITFDPERAEKEGIRVRVWDFLFYVIFAVVITISVRITGVLLVFSFLIVPSACSVLFVTDLRRRLILCWILSAVVSLVGLRFSFDLPSGPMIVCVFGIALLLFSLVRYVLNATRKGVALSKIGLTAATILAAYALSVRFLSGPGDTDAQPLPEQVALASSLPSGASDADRALLADLASQDEKACIQAIDALAARKEGAAYDTIVKLARTGSNAVRDEAVRKLPLFGRADTAKLVREWASHEKDADLRYTMALALAELGDREGVNLLISLLHEGDSPFFRSEVLESLQRVTGDAFGYDSDKDAKANDDALHRFDDWWRAHGEKLGPDEVRKAASTSK